MGLGLGYFALVSGSLRVPMLIHFVNNASAVVLSLALPLLPPWIQGLFSLVQSLGYLIWGLLAAAWLLRRKPALLQFPRARGTLGGREKALSFLLHPAMVLFVCVMVFFMALNFAQV